MNAAKLFRRSQNIHNTQRKSSQAQSDEAEPTLLSRSRPSFGYLTMVRFPSQ